MINGMDAGVARRDGTHKQNVKDHGADGLYTVEALLALAKKIAANLDEDSARDVLTLPNAFQTREELPWVTCIRITFGGATIGGIVGIDMFRTIDTRRYEMLVAKLNRFWLVVCAMTFVFAAPTSAETFTSREVICHNDDHDNHALLVGVHEYLHVDEWGELPLVLNEVRELSSALFRSFRRRRSEEPRARDFESAC